MRLLSKNSHSVELALGSLKPMSRVPLNKAIRLPVLAQEFAGRQHGVVARCQLAGAGVRKTTIDSSIGVFLHPLFPGTFAVGRSSVNQHGLWMAGTLCAGPGAVLGYRSAAGLWGFRRADPPVDVVRSRHRMRCRATVDLGGRQVISYLQVRRTRNLPERDIAFVQGIPVTTVARTLLNLSAILPAPDFDRAFLEADRLGLLKDSDLLDCLQRSNGHRGAAKFRKAIVQRIPGVTNLRSVLEVLFLRLCRDHGITRPETNVRIASLEVDCLWREPRLIVELDGYEFHRGMEKLEQDAARSAALAAQGWNVMRLTWRMITTEPEVAAGRVRDALAVSPSRVETRGQASTVETISTNISC